MPITPPKCKTCGVAEYNHTCSGASKAARALAKAKPPAKAKQKFAQGKGPR